jgi:serine-type D-Ala-D-Ala carboxypeptidase (penicillin-binding protein 5/6)
VAALAGAWVGSRRPVPATRSAASVTPEIAVAAKPVAHKGAVRPETLLEAHALVRHAFSPRLGAKAAIVVDEDTGRVIWAYHAHERRPVASTTKIMTALLALKRLRPNDLVTVDAAVTRVPLVREGLHAGEEVQAWKIFYSLLLYSGNDDALQLAITAGGSKPEFLADMNDEARRLGLHDTHFVSPSGVIDKGNYSSAWDLAALTRVAMRNARFRAIVRTPVKRVKWAAPTYSKIYINNNRMLRTYPGANGVKTGYTHKSGPCLVASATRNGVSLIAVVLDDPGMYDDATRLLDFGFRES